MMTAIAVTTGLLFIAAMLSAVAFVSYLCRDEGHMALAFLVMALLVGWIGFAMGHALHHDKWEPEAKVESAATGGTNDAGGNEGAE